MKNRHEPEAEFVERLEWQLRSELRRGTLEEIGERRNVRAWLTRAALVLLSVLAGAAAVRAAQSYQDRWRAELALERAKTAVEVTDARRDVYREALADLRDEAGRGLVDQLTVAAMENEITRMELDAKRARLVLEEVELSGGSTRDELYAPLVGGRDFVLERLDLDRRGAEERVRWMQSWIDRVESGAFDPAETESQLLGAQAEIQQARLQLELVEDRIKLRNQFLKGETTAAQVALLESLADVERRLEENQQRLDQLRKEEDRLRRAGVSAKSHEWKHLKLALFTVAAEIRLAESERQLLRRGVSIDR